MKHAEPRFSVRVDVANPGQFFACCGLLELAHRLWPGAEGWFPARASVFTVSTSDEGSASLERLVSELSKCEISGLSEAERQERQQLEAESSQLKKQKQKLPPDKEARRMHLGTEAREGKIHIGRPFDLSLDWWQTSDDDVPSPKTWAGRQELHRIARAAQDALLASGDMRAVLDQSGVLREPKEYRKNKRQRGQGGAVEPFYFDARRFTHALDTGYSLDTHDAETLAHPAVELLSLIGLQRFRPALSPVKWSFEYWTWPQPLSAHVAAGVVCGSAPVPGHRGYRFALLFRDDQKRYKAFSFATQIGGDT